jgi:hypothetical protein
VRFRILLKIFLWVKLCFKVGDNGVNVSSSGATWISHGSPTQIKSILVDICETVLVTIIIHKVKKQTKVSNFVRDVRKWVRLFQFSIFIDVLR